MPASRFKVTLSCRGIPEKEGRTGIANIMEEFQSRPWHENISCVWEDEHLWLRAENDFDSDGNALALEFSDVVCACVQGTFTFGDGDLRDPRVSPRFSAHVSDVPALIYTAGFDVLRDEARSYADRLKMAGTRVAYREFPNLIHGFVLMTEIRSALAATNAIAADIRRELEASTFGEAPARETASI